jgi:general secretion pathway protein H
LGDSGFTLIEMLVVIAVMAITLLLITNFRQPHSRWLETQAAARQVAAAMRNARGLAITGGQPVAVILPPHLPAWLAVTEQPSGGIWFAPDGSGSGGSVELGGGGQNIRVSADWLTGRVQVDAQ